MNLRQVGTQWLGLLAGLSTRQRISLGLVVALVAGSLAGFVWWKQEQDFAPLFKSMNPEDAAAVVEKLKETGVEYRVSDNGGAVSVRTAHVAETRLQLAAAGLPKTGRIGFELFDKTNLGSTDFAEQVNYRRALEGELERSIRAVGVVEQARVHLTFPKDSVFLESRLPAKASVLLQVRSGSTLAPQNITAIRNLVASAVEGLAASAVSVMDVDGNLLGKPKNVQENGDAADEHVEYRQRVERDLLEKINTTLQPLLGEGKYRAGVSVECDFSSGEQSEELYDPDKSVMTSSTKTEDTSTGGGSSGIPGTASNLPRSAPRGASTGPTMSRRSETIAYQTSKTVRRLHLPQGAIKRVSASILLDQAVQWNGQGPKAQRVFVPPSPESLRAIREVVSAVIGFNQTRGDQLVIESLPFGTTLDTPPPPLPTAPVAPAPREDDNWLTTLMQRRVEAAVILVACAVAAFLFLRRRKKRVNVRVEAPKSLPQSGENGRLDAEGERAMESAALKLLESTGGSELNVRAARVETLISALRDNIAEDPALAASVLRNWIDDPRK